MTASVVLVAAVAKNGVIGRDNGLPWRLSTDLKRFKQLTLGGPMVMGRKTYQSIGKPLPGRRTIVVTRDPGFSAEGMSVAPTPEEALRVAQADAAEMGAETIAVVGGAEIYRATIGLADRLEITEVDCTVDGDAHFPEILPAEWTEVSRMGMSPGAKDDHAMSFVSYVRKGSDHEAER